VNSSLSLPASDGDLDLQGRRPNINDVARLAGVSKKTVSRVINDATAVGESTRARVRAIIEQTGYVPDPQARALAQGRSCLVGLVYETVMAPSMMLMPFGMLDALRGSGFEMVIHPSNISSPGFLDDLAGFVQRQRLFGVMLTPPISDDPRVTALLDKLGCPYVGVGSNADTPSARVIDTHDRIGAQMAAEHLTSLGHQHFAFVAGPGFAATQDRLAGFRLGLEAQGLSLADEDIIEAGFGFEGGWAAGERILARSTRPTAVFCDTDEIAAGVLRACQLVGVDVPGQLSIMGYGDFRIAPVAWPPLTTVKSTTRDIGRLAMERLLGGGEAPLETPMPTLVVRGSTGPAIA
jgi:LacI family transcriptional regulator